MIPTVQYNDPGHGSPTSESPPRHRKSASATLKTVSSFLSLKGGISKGVRVSSSEPERIDTPSALAMLPLTEAHYDYDFDKAERTNGEMGAEGTWHNPNVMQMAETLGTVMMTGAATDGLPVAYNSCVLALIEGFYRLTRQLRDTEKEFAELKTLREMELEQFRGMMEECMEKGEAYMAEIKRLELALAKESKDGVACVALMRHGSLVDRAGSRRFQAKLKRISGSQDEGMLTLPGSLESMVQPRTESLELAEATTSYRTLGAIPRILDAQNDLLVSRIVEEREIQEQRARHQQGRVRAAPVLVHLRSDRGSHNARDEPRRRGQPFDHGMDRNTSLGTQRTEATKDSHTQVDDAPRPRAQSQISTDNESSSSDSDTSTEVSLARLTLSTHVRQVHENLGQSPAEHASKEGFHLKGATGKEYPESFMSGSQQGDEIANPSDSDSTPKPVHTGPNVDKNSGTLGEHREPRPADAKQRKESFWKGARLSFQEPSHQQRRRGYSFEKGDDEVLPVSPTWMPKAHTQLKPPASEGCAARRETDRFLAVMAGRGCAPRSSSGMNRPAATPSSDVSSGSITSSASTGTVKWAGSDKVDVNEGCGSGGRIDGKKTGDAV
ncbi:hypothetical protein C8A03DRAFT_11288 [Achaetomium macrosporum]|uniref:Uncharacterized protein n=1 Tax=Achaetomium macrosporum TaxID=79813 RepID=A0AAN7HAD2_9PEZI|nr:hypothetical protein C8A03DRAFT_11288 [Achaetomium macrosporum]